MPTTTAKGIPLPVGADNNDNVADMTALGNWLDAMLGGKTTAAIQALAGAALWTGRREYNTTVGEEWYYDGTVWRGSQAFAGTIKETVKSTADPGWALMGQTLVGAQTAYPNLWAAAPTSWRSGSDLVLPSMTDKTLGGDGATTLGASGGGNTVTIASANLPVHTHTGPSHQHAGPDHFHSGPSHFHTQPSHQHNANHAHSGSIAGAGSHEHTVSGSTNNDGTHQHYWSGVLGLITLLRRTAGSGPNSIPVGGGSDLLEWSDSTGNLFSTHQHAMSFATSGGPGNHAHGLTVDGNNFNVSSGGGDDTGAAGTGNTGNAGTGNTAAGGTGATGDGGFANTALAIRNSFLAVKYMIKLY